MFEYHTPGLSRVLHLLPCSLSNMVFGHTKTKTCLQRNRSCFAVLLTCLGRFLGLDGEVDSVGLGLICLLECFKVLFPFMHAGALTPSYTLVCGCRMCPVFAVKALKCLWRKAATRSFFLDVCSGQNPCSVTTTKQILASEVRKQNPCVNTACNCRQPSR